MNHMPTMPCPPADVLSDYIQNALAEELSSSVESHVERCPNCLGVLNDLLGSSQDRSLERLLRNEGPCLFPGAKRPDAPVPEKLGPYYIVGEIGRGTYGVVYQGLDEVLGRRVAIKVPHPHIIQSVGDDELYLKEARALAALQHPHIVNVYEARGGSSCYVVSQFIDGCNLADYLQEHRLTPIEAVKILLPLIDALQHAHENGVIHRDIKPANILIRHDGQPYLADFGLALQADEVGCGHSVLGTPAYASPEQASGDGNLVDGRTDIFSLGVVFYKMLTGKRPFQATSAEQLLDLIVNVDTPSVRQKDRAIPKELDRCCAKALMRDPGQRYQSAGDWYDDLSDWLIDQSSVSWGSGPLPLATRTSTAKFQWRTLLRRCQRRPLVPILMLLMTLMSLSLLAFNVWPDSRSKTIRVGIKPWVGYSPLVVADELGLCEDFDIDLRPIHNTTDARQKLLSKELDAAPCLVDSHAFNRADRFPAKVILQLDVSLDADAIVSLDSINLIEELRGKTVAYVHHEAPHFLLLSLCDKAGVNPNDFVHLRVETAAQAAEKFLQGEADAAVTYEPYIMDALQRPGSHRLASAADDVGAIIDILTVHETLLQTDRKKVDQLISAWFKAVELLESKDPKAIEIACRFLGDPGQPITRAQYLEMASGMRYSGLAENLEFFRVDASGDSEFYRRFNAAQSRWDGHHQLSRKTDPKDGDGSELIRQFAP